MQESQNVLKLVELIALRVVNSKLKEFIDTFIPFVEIYGCGFFDDNISEEETSEKKHNPLEKLLQPIVKDIWCGTILDGLSNYVPEKSDEKIIEERGGEVTVARKQIAIQIRQIINGMPDSAKIRDDICMCIFKAAEHQFHKILIIKIIVEKFNEEVEKNNSELKIPAITPDINSQIDLKLHENGQIDIETTAIEIFKARVNSVPSEKRFDYFAAIFNISFSFPYNIFPKIAEWAWKALDDDSAKEKLIKMNDYLTVIYGCCGNLDKLYLILTITEEIINQPNIYKEILQVGDFEAFIQACRSEISTKFFLGIAKEIDNRENTGTSFQIKVLTQDGKHSAFLDSIKLHYMNCRDEQGLVHDILLEKYREFGFPEEVLVRLISEGMADCVKYTHSNFEHFRWCLKKIKQGQFNIEEILSYDDFCIIKSSYLKPNQNFFNLKRLDLETMWTIVHEEFPDRFVDPQQIKSENEAMKQKINQSKLQEQDQQKNLQPLATSNQLLQKNVDCLTSENQQLSTLNEALHKEIKHTSEERESQKHERQQTEILEQKLETENKGLVQKLEQPSEQQNSDAVNDENYDKVSKLFYENSQLKTQREGLKRELEQIEVLQESFRAEIDRLQTFNQFLQETVITLTTKNQQLKTLNEELHQKLEQIKREQENHKTRIQQQRASVQDLQRKGDKATTGTTELKGKLEQPRNQQMTDGNDGIPDKKESEPHSTESIAQLLKGEELEAQENIPKKIIIFDYDETLVTLDLVNVDWNVPGAQAERYLIGGRATKEKLKDLHESSYVMYIATHANLEGAREKLEFLEKEEIAQYFKKIIIVDRDQDPDKSNVISQLTTTIDGKCPPSDFHFIDDRKDIINSLQNSDQLCSNVTLHCVETNAQQTQKQNADALLGTLATIIFQQVVEDADNIHEIPLDPSSFDDFHQVCCEFMHKSGRWFEKNHYSQEVVKRAVALGIVDKESMNELAYQTKIKAWLKGNYICKLGINELDGDDDKFKQLCGEIIDQALRLYAMGKSDKPKSIIDGLEKAIGLISSKKPEREAEAKDPDFDAYSILKEMCVAKDNRQEAKILYDAIHTRRHGFFFNPGSPASAKAINHKIEQLEDKEDTVCCGFSCSTQVSN